MSIRLKKKLSSFSKNPCSDFHPKSLLDLCCLPNQFQWSFWQQFSLSRSRFSGKGLEVLEFTGSSMNGKNKLYPHLEYQRGLWKNAQHGNSLFENPMLGCRRSEFLVTCLCFNKTRIANIMDSPQTTKWTICRHCIDGQILLPTLHELQWECNQKKSNQGCKITNNRDLKGAYGQVFEDLN